ncbi:transcriptional regulator CynR [Dyella choica]|uniref:Transcriptional regulator CynR n=2 Tax=Dyella choica TaxID=1927959 RepID=A0A3S0S2S2_9GAMM|nr:transcriptional regulator CynR [Dyella choica]
MLLRHIHYFLAVADHGGFTRAAAALHVSQPALSQQIKQLEETLGVPLFDRTGRTTRLTDAGQVYQDYARRALLDLQAGKRALHDVQDLSRGALRLGLTPTFTSYLMGPLVEAFHRRHPRIVLTVRELPQEKMEQLLSDDQLDVGIAFDEVRSPDIETQTLLVETLALVVGKAHPYAQKRTIGLQALNDESMVLLSAEFATREQIDRHCRQHGAQPRVAIEANSISAVVEIVRRTTLSTLLPADVAAQHSDLSAVALNPKLLERTAVLLQRKGAYHSAAHRAFVELALDSLTRKRRRRA